jgi:hypothetical protein
MKIEVIRHTFTERSTIGSLYLNGKFECYTLEDVVRVGEKVPGATAIQQPVQARPAIAAERAEL